MKHKIITGNVILYNALSSLRHNSEVSISKPVNYKAIDIILKNSNNNLIAISRGSDVILKKMVGFDFEVYFRNK